MISRLRCNRVCLRHSSTSAKGISLRLTRDRWASCADRAYRRMEPPQRRDHRAHERQLVELAPNVLPWFDGDMKHAVGRGAVEITMRPPQRRHHETTPRPDAQVTPRLAGALRTAVQRTIRSECCGGPAQELRGQDCCWPACPESELGGSARLADQVLNGFCDETWQGSHSRPQSEPRCEDARFLAWR
jgi:hypothetical protein